LPPYWNNQVENLIRVFYYQNHSINVDLFFRGSRLKDEFNITAPIEAYPENVY
jgi:hypothetical protein